MIAMPSSAFFTGIALISSLCDYSLKDGPIFSDRILGLAKVIFKIQ